MARLFRLIRACSTVAWISALPSPRLPSSSAFPHHLIDVAEPDQIWSLALFQERASQAIAAIHQRGRLPFLVGGTGQYLRAVTEGWLPPAVQPIPRLRAALEAWADEIGNDGLHARLATLRRARRWHRCRATCAAPYAPWR